VPASSPRSENRHRPADCPTPSADDRGTPGLDPSISSERGEPARGWAAEPNSNPNTARASSLSGLIAGCALSIRGMTDVVVPFAVRAQPRQSKGAMSRFAPQCTTTGGVPAPFSTGIK
jgi:hypothetical protein